MCGRYVLTQNLAEICVAFGVTSALNTLVPHYNVAPETMRPVIIKDRLGAAQWGWPAAANAPVIINIRSETMAEKMLFAPAVRLGRRCVIPASGFYDWDAAGQPFYVHGGDAPLIGLCGLWTRDETRAIRFGVLTRAAVQNLTPIHPRMPAIVTPQDAAAWLETGALPEPPMLAAWPVTHDVNKTANNSPDLLTPLPHAPQGNLFAAN